MSVIYRQVERINEDVQIWQYYIHVIYIFQFCTTSGLSNTLVDDDT